MVGVVVAIGVVVAVFVISDVRSDGARLVLLIAAVCAGFGS